MTDYRATLSQLYDQVQAGSDYDAEVTGLTLDSRQVAPGMLFIAVRGLVVDGRDYVQQAIASGASAIMVEAGHETWSNTALVNHVPVVVIPGLAQKVSGIAASFYRQPANDMTVVGVTGTNGKTSTTWLIAQLLEQLNAPAAIIGTLGIGKVSAGEQALVKTGHTTPDAVSIQRNLSALRDQQIAVTCMEVSSHGLVQHRVSAVPFKVAAFTNLSHDHLDFHGDLASYAEAKQSLFLQPGVETAVVNIDDDMGVQLIARLAQERPAVTCVGISLKGQMADWSISDLQCNAQGTTLTLAVEQQTFVLSLPIIGTFNIANIMMAAAIVHALGYAVEAILKQLGYLSLPPGRMNTYRGDGKTVVVDYAHTPDALEKVLQALRPYAEQQLVCVFGCGGDRDRAKRPVMARVAEQCADRVVVTADNPRTETQQQISADIKAGFADVSAVAVIEDRQQAITAAINEAVAGDVVLVAGKGHEDYQELATGRIAFDDRKLVQQLLAGQFEHGQADTGGLQCR